MFMYQVKNYIVFVISALFGFGFHNFAKQILAIVPDVSKSTAVTLLGFVMCIIEWTSFLSAFFEQEFHVFGF